MITEDLVRRLNEICKKIRENGVIKINPSANSRFKLVPKSEIDKLPKEPIELYPLSFTSYFDEEDDEYDNGKEVQSLNLLPLD